MEKSEEQSDNIFMMIAQHTTGIEELLNNFFGFLQRRTDFYIKDINYEEEMVEKNKNNKNNDINYSFPCKKLLLKYYEEYKIKAKKQILEKKKKTENIKNNNINYKEEKRNIIEKQNMENRPKIEEIFDDEEEEKLQMNKNSINISNNSNKNKNNTDVNNKNINVNKNNIDINNKNKDINNNIESDKIIKDKNNFDNVDDDNNEEDSEQSQPPPGNGGKTDKYVWTQTLGSVEVIVPVPQSTKSSQCIVDIQKQYIKVGLKGKHLIIDGKLNSSVKVEDCMWTLVDSNTIQINLEKIDNMRWWDCVIIGDPTIDTKKIVPENSKLGDLDGETRATVEKMMLEMRQKSLGLPTPEQEKQEKILNKFKAAHPEFDFSKTKVNWGSSNQFQL